MIDDGSGSSTIKLQVAFFAPFLILKNLPLLTLQNISLGVFEFASSISKSCPFISSLTPSVLWGTLISIIYTFPTWTLLEKTWAASEKTGFVRLIPRSFISKVLE